MRDAQRSAATVPGSGTGDVVGGWLVTEHLCTAPSCRVRNEHTPDCADEQQCTGCRPDVAEVGSAFCQRCTDRLAAWLLEIPTLFDEVTNPPDATNQATADLHAVDPVTTQLPAGPIPGPSRNPRVSGSTEDQLAARYVEAAGGTTRLERDRSGRLYLDDQLGDPPPAVQLDAWCRDWQAHRGLGELLPDPTVDLLCRWLSMRLQDALKSHPAMVEFYTEVHSMHSRLWVEAGRTEPKQEPCLGVPCKRCDRRDLWRTVDGSGDIECHTPDCRRVYRRDEFDEWTKLCSGPAYRDWLVARAQREKEPIDA